MHLKKPRALIELQLKEKENLRRTSKRKRTIVSYKVDDVTSSSNTVDENFVDDDDGYHINKRPHLFLDKDFTKAKCFQPMARRPTTDDFISILGKKFRVPSTDQSNGSTSIDERRTLGLRRRHSGKYRILHDPKAEDAFVVWDPEVDQDPAPAEEQPKPVDKENEDEDTLLKPKLAGKSLNDILGLKKQKFKKGPVVVDPVLAKILRPHQVDGVRFLFRCTTGRVDPNAFGCIMADEMGLGKTLQCISLVWTLLRQSEFVGKPTITKAIITCPSSLVRNWANEIVKWLGDRVRPLAIDSNNSKEKKTAVKRWATAQGQLVNPILIISYETLRSYTKYMKNCSIGLLLCDEGHRLKNGDSMLFKELNKLQVKRRVILSGTPIQNDLSEYYNLLDFANPGLLGTPSEFRKNFELPILRGRDSDASDTVRELSDAKVAEFWAIVSKFTIRRTNDILTKYLPTKFEHVVFCQLSTLQEDLYNVFLTSPEIKRLLRGQGSQPLKAITMLKKLCNHPDLLDLPKELEGSEKVLPPSYRGVKDKGPVESSLSGKFMVLDRMLANIKRETDDKIVIVSNYTQTLDLFERFCQQKQYGVLRLDGSMNITKRQKLVDQFNDPEGEEFVFLLSSKAGGCGLNLIGANRLVLFDPDWNPAADQQALARVWRDGQRKDCYIYRFIASGTIEEKIFQRQSHKQSLSNCVVDEATDAERHFSLENMRQLFQLNTSSECETHDTFKCKRCIKGKQFKEADTVQYADTST
ncbi:hypothetical protein DM01DRAFT_1285609 [Hesseltinella vesiculosa]|uniref:Uncharacterized protein n=1 Tax=Hesseltinella vesiculosa TaxID=101127 RepID=A0A1X2GMA7_9FUNG|nr:hypothetical protein DM01DRAFT_1285609 [Hesseltinella vesiculosa]